MRVNQIIKEGLIEFHIDVTNILVLAGAILRKGIFTIIDK